MCWNAAEFAVFGINEIGARIVNAIIGITEVNDFYLLKRGSTWLRDPRLRFFIFAIRLRVGTTDAVFPQQPWYWISNCWAPGDMWFSIFLYERYWQNQEFRVPASASRWWP